MTYDLNKIIPGEISGDSFYQALFNLARKDGVYNILEIGSSSGAGSTQAFVDALRARSDLSAVSLFCIELSPERFLRLEETYALDHFVKAYNVSSVSTDEFPTASDIIRFFITQNSRMRKKQPLAKFSLPEFNVPLISKYLKWRTRDINYIRSLDKDFNGIDIIKKENGINTFDLVLIDGSEFTGEAELRHVIGAKYIALDDILTYKSFNVYRHLSFDKNYKVIEQDFDLRNGYAIFEWVT